VRDGGRSGGSSNPALSMARIGSEVGATTGIVSVFHLPPLAPALHYGGGCLITEPLDSRSASTAPRPATEAGVNLADRRRTLLRRRDQRENLFVADDIARADDHDIVSTSNEQS
jgi:hypothetical protein